MRTVFVALLLGALLFGGGRTGVGAVRSSAVGVGATAGVAGRAGSRTSPVAAGAVHYAAPVSGPLRVVRGFEPPPTRYAAGHRGVDLATRAGQTVRAAADGVVTFAGAVAGRGVVVLAHADGVSTEYEPVRPVVSAGESVRRGQPIGRVRGRHGDCAPGGCLHWGARRAGGYLDPLTLLRRLGVVRLLPWQP